jgi:ABC-type branched-subunit amino acid transport system substrate-binding protein
MKSFSKSMIRHKWLIILAMVLILTACGPAKTLACPPIKIGIILNGSDTTANTEQNQGFEQALQQINAQGIGNGCKVELVYPSENQDPQAEKYQQDVQDLVTQGVVAIIAPTNDDGAQLVANIAGYFNIPVIIPADTGDEIMPANDQWIYRISPPMSDYAAAVMSQLAGTQTSRLSNLAIFYEHSDYGESVAVSFAKAALAKNLQLSIYQGYSPFAQDYTDLNTALTGKNPNIVLIIATQTSQASAIYQMVKQTLSGGLQTVSGTIIGNGSGFTSNSFLYDSSGNLNSDLNGLVLTLPWSGNSSHQGDTTCSQVTVPDTALGTGSPLTLRAAQSAVSLGLVGDALQKVTQIKSWTIEKTTITNWEALLRSSAYLPAFRQSLAQALPEVQGCQFSGILYPIQFSNGGQNQITPLLVQITNGNFMTIYPQR